jgi:O-antigen ligase
MRSVSGYQEDNSAKARLQAWGAAVRMAADHPLGVGAGNFGSAYGRYYRPPEDQGALSWGAGRWLSAHSIYFRILGEYGLPGLVLLISLIWLNIRDNLRAHRTLVAAGKAARISPIWPALLNMSVVGHAVCGIFLGGWASPHIFLLTALTISTSRLAAASQYRPIVTLAHRNARRAVRH